MFHGNRKIATREKLIDGSIEVRNSGNKRFIYVHFRKDGQLISKYVGEYSTDIHNVVLENNHFARAYKRRLREMNKELSREIMLENPLMQKLL